MMSYSLLPRVGKKVLPQIFNNQNIIFTPVVSIKTQPTFNPEEIPKGISPVFTNRNPRNLEKLTIAKKPSGYFLDRPVRSFWHKLEVVQSNRYVNCQIIHNNGKVVISASSNEWPIKRRLFSYQDKVAYTTLGKVLAQRCLESGIDVTFCCLEAKPGGKLESFLEAFKNGGVSLKEPPTYVDPYPWSKTRPEKPGEPDE